MADNNGNIVKRSTQYIDNLGFNEDTQLKSVEIGGTDGVAVRRLKINSDGSINVTGGSAAAQTVSKIDDTTTANVVYIGKAELTGAAISTAGAVWQIKKLDTSSLALDKKWADGDSSYNNVWDNRDSLTYY